MFNETCHALRTSPQLFPSSLAVLWPDGSDPHLDGCRWSEAAQSAADQLQSEMLHQLNIMSVFCTLTSTEKSGDKTLDSKAGRSCLFELI